MRTIGRRSLLAAAALSHSARRAASFSAAASPSMSAPSSSSRASFDMPPIPPSTAEAIVGLEPAALWGHFAALSSIPRPSGKEAAAASYVASHAASLGLQWTTDAKGNLAVFRPGSGGGETAPPVLLQGHLDMVTEKNADSAHDFDTDPILLQQLEDGWLGARGTTLGADNGIGVAATLAILGAPQTKKLPPIEALFTVEEETGLHGAAALDVAALGLKARTVLNLDMEAWPDLFVGCAGGGDSHIDVPLERMAERPPGLTEALEIRVEGLMGGHSGLNIHEGRANAVVLGARAARKALEAVRRGDDTSVPAAALLAMAGGDKHNAIPRESSVRLAISPAAKPIVEECVRAFAKEAAEEFGLLERRLSIAVKNVGECDDAGNGRAAPLTESSAERLLSVLVALPHGPIKFSHALPGLVETSNNLAAVDVPDDASCAHILCSSRSSIASALEHTRASIKAIATLARGSVAQSDAYPGWNPNPDSALLGATKRLLAQRLGDGRSPGVNAVHAGLECGLLIEKLGGDCDAISFGPTIKGAHSPDERVELATVPPFYELVEAILEEYASH